jgi:hypothetical protein
MNIAEIKRACALITTIVVLFTSLKNNPQNEHPLKHIRHKDAKLPNETSVCPPPLETEHAHNYLWNYACTPSVLAQHQTRIKYKHFETSEPFEPITGKRKGAILPNETSVCPPETDHAHNPLWKYESSPSVLAQHQTRMEYTHLKTVDVLAERTE